MTCILDSVCLSLEELLLLPTPGHSSLPYGKGACRARVEVIRTLLPTRYHVMSPCVSAIFLHALGLDVTELP